MKKRVLSLLLTLVLLCAALPALAEDAAPGVAGTWKMTRYTVGERVIDDPEAAGSTKILFFNPDGTAQVTINDKVYGATWTQEGEAVHLLYDDGDKAEFAVDGEQLVYHTGNQVQYFSRLISETPDEMNPLGCWASYAVETDGVIQLTDSSVFSEQVYLYADGTGLWVVQQGESVSTMTFNWVQQEEQIYVTLSNGTSAQLRLKDGDLLLDLPQQNAVGHMHPVDWLADDVQPIPAVGVQDYVGSWVLCAFDATALGYPHIFPEAVFSMEYAMTISEDKATLINHQKGQEQVNMTNLVVSFADSRLQLAPENAPDGGTVPMSLYANGWISLNISGPADTPITLFFEQVEVEE